MTRPLRIAVASSGLGHVSRGIEAWADDLATALSDRGEEVILCRGAGAATRPFERVVSCLQREAPATARLLRLLPRSLSWRVGLGSGYDVEQTSFALNLVRLLRRERPDVLHVQDPQVAIITQRARRLGLVRTRTILAHGTEESPDFLKRIHYLQHLAPWHLEQMRAADAWKPAWTAIPNFIDTDRFRPGRADALRAELGIPADAFVVLTAAAIKRNHKRVDHLIAEVARLRAGSPRLPVWLVVAGGWEKETDGLIAEGTRLLGDRVRFLVRFPRQRMPDLYRAADAFALGSLFEMMPIALIEAAASGLSCVVHRHPILEWMTGPGGVAIDMSAPGQLAASLAGLASGSGERGRHARAHCVANFSRTAVVEQILEYYQRVAGRAATEAVV
jgi:glycosyltransferase involved in cell wall biosynthesis